MKLNIKPITMKTKILVLALILGTAVAANAQKVSFGPKASVNLSHFWGDTPANTNHIKPGVSTGFFFTYSSDAAIGFTGEVLYSQKGSRYDIPGALDNDIEGRYRLDYIEVPFDVRFFLTKAGKVRPHISAGPTMGIMVVSKNHQDEPVEMTTSMRSATNMFDLGANVAMGVNIIVKKIWINPEVRYTLGLLNVNDGGPNDYRNGALSIGVGVGFLRTKAPKTE
jgi:hypothetical protein